MSLTRLARRRSFRCRSVISEKNWAADSASPGFARFTPDGAFQDYDVEVYFEGPVDPKTGMIVNLAAVDQLIERTLTPLNEKDLSTLPEFERQSPSPENIIAHLAKQMIAKKDLPGVFLVKARLYVNENYWVDVWP